MDRRHFLATGALATASTLLPASAAVAATEQETLFQNVNFYSDGLALNPREYAVLLDQATKRTGFTPDNYSRGGAVEALETKFAARLGKEAAIFLPTGTLANHVAVRKLAGNSPRALVQAESHLYNDTGDGAQALSGLTLLPLAPGQASFTLDDAKAWAARTAGGRVESRIGVLSIESPVRRQQHRFFDFDELVRLCDWAREQGIRRHLDGARLFNLPAACSAARCRRHGLPSPSSTSTWTTTKPTTPRPGRPPTRSSPCWKPAAASRPASSRTAPAPSC